MQLLEVVDVLDMAIKSVPADEALKGGNSHLKNLYDGIVLTEKEVMKVVPLALFSLLSPLCSSACVPLQPSCVSFHYSALCVE